MISQSQTHQSGRSNSEPVDINVIDRARAATIMMVDRVSHPHRGIANRLANVARDLVNCARLYGFNESELRLPAMMLDGIVDDLFHPLGEDAEHFARRAESDADRAEDAANDATLIEGESAVLLEVHAARLDRQAATSRQLARTLRAKARRLRTDLEVQRRITIDRLTAKER